MQVARSHDLVVLVLAAVVFGLSIWSQSTVLLNHDVGWVLYSAGVLLRGGSFGSDVLAANPPLAWYLTLPGAALAATGLATPWTTLRLWLWLLIFACCTLTWITLRPLRTSGRRLEADTLFLATVVVCAFLPAGEFGQREHLSLALGIPYLLASASRFDLAQPPAKAWSIVVGVLAGLAFALKPYFLIVPLLVTLLLAARARRISAVWTTENLAAIAVIAVYGASIPLFAPDYLETAVPLFAAVYWGFENVTTQALLTRLHTAGGFLVISCALLAFARRVSGVQLVLGLAGGGYAVAYWIQHKGYAYQQYPVTGFALLLLASSSAFTVAQIATRARFAWTRNFPVAATLVAALLYVTTSGLLQRTLSWREQSDRENGDIGQAQQAVIDRLDALTDAGDYVYALSTHPFPAFPTVNYLDVRWAGRSNSLFAVPALVKAAAGEGTVGQRAGLVAAEAYQRAAVLESIRDFRPRVVMIDRSHFRHGIGLRKFDDIAYFGADPAFRREWSHYVEVKPVNRVRFFVREGGSSAGPHPDESPVAPRRPDEKAGIG